MRGHHGYEAAGFGNSNAAGPGLVEGSEVGKQGAWHQNFGGPSHVSRLPRPRAALCPPRPPPPTKQHSSGNVVLWPPGPLPTLPPANPTHRCYPHTPTFHAPLMLPTHPMPRSLAVWHAHASACLCTAQSLTKPHPNLADSCGAVCAAARRSWSLLPVISFSVPLVFPTAQELACVSFRSVVAPPRHVACITSGHGGGL